MNSGDRAKQMDFMRNKLMAIDDKDRQVWELITDVPKLSMLWAVACFIVNIIVPGKAAFLEA